MNIQAYKLLIGTFIITILYVLFGPKTINNYYMLVTPVEAYVYTLLVLYVFSVKKKFYWFILPFIAGALNYFLLILWPLIGNFISLLSDLFSLGKPLTSFILLAFYSVLGATLYCLLLDIFSVIEKISRKTYTYVAVLCFFAGIPVLLPIASYLPLHKALWWLMFSVGLILLLRSNQESTDSRRLKPKNQVSN